MRTAEVYSLSAGELIDLLIQVGELPKRAKTMGGAFVSVRIHSSFEWLGVGGEIKIEVPVEEKVPIDKFRIRDKKSFFNPTPSKY